MSYKILKSFWELLAPAPIRRSTPEPLTEDFKEYRPKFTVQLHHDNKKCSTSNPQLLYFGDESCKKIGIQGYIGRRIDEDVLELLATGSYNRITPTIAIFVCSIMFAYVV